MIRRCARRAPHACHAVFLVRCRLGVDDDDVSEVVAIGRTLPVQESNDEIDLLPVDRQGIREIMNPIGRGEIVGLPPGVGRGLVGSVRYRGHDPFTPVRRVQLRDLGRGVVHSDVEDPARRRCLDLALGLMLRDRRRGPERSRGRCAAPLREGVTRCIGAGLESTVIVARAAAPLSRAALLKDMREFVSQQPPAGSGLWPRLVRAEVDVFALRNGAGRGSVRQPILVQPYRGQVFAKRRFRIRLPCAERTPLRAKVVASGGTTGVHAPGREREPQVVVRRLGGNTIAAAPSLTETFPSLLRLLPGEHDASPRLRG